MSQETSLRAYYTKVLPNLGKRQAQVLAVFRRNSRLNWTNMELAAELGWSINRVTPRVLELRKLGALVTATRRRCLITGNESLAWRLA